MKIKFFLKHFLLLTVGLIVINTTLSYFVFEEINLTKEVIVSLISGTLLALGFTYANSHRLK